MKKLILLLAVWIVSAGCQSKKNSSPELDSSDFVQLHEVIPNITYDIRYFGSDSFVGAPVDGYEKATAYMTKEAATALKQVQAALNKEGLGLKVFDAYRPQKAVDHFMRWGKAVADTLTKAKYYPEIDKSKVFEMGYVARRSGHTRGSTVDLTIIDLETKEELDMGSGFDYFGAISHHDSPLVGETHTANRNKLRAVMVAHGFKPYANEWWHYTLANEPYPATYFNFDVK